MAQFNICIYIYICIFNGKKIGQSSQTAIVVVFEKGIGIRSYVWSQKAPHVPIFGPVLNSATFRRGQGALGANHHVHGSLDVSCREAFSTIEATIFTHASCIMQSTLEIWVDLCHFDSFCWFACDWRWIHHQQPLGIGSKASLSFCLFVCYFVCLFVCLSACLFENKGCDVYSIWACLKMQ